MLGGRAKKTLNSLKDLNENLESQDMGSTS